MSKQIATQTQAKVNCPACGAETEMTVTYAITPGSDAFQQLFEGKINQGSCPECDTRFALSSPLVFRDDQGGLLLYQMPLEEHSSWSTVENQVAELAHEAFADLPEESRPDCRLTFNRRDFIEKIAIYSAGLEDRLLEYIKYQMFSREDDPVDHIRYDLLLDFSQQDPEKLTFILFDRETGAPAATANIPMETYYTLEDAFQDNSGLFEELNRVFPGPYVSVERLFD